MFDFFPLPPFKPSSINPNPRPDIFEELAMAPPPCGEAVTPRLPFPRVAWLPPESSARVDPIEPMVTRATVLTRSFILHGFRLDPTILACVVVQRAAIVSAAVDPHLFAVLQKDGV